MDSASQTVLTKDTAGLSSDSATLFSETENNARSSNETLECGCPPCYFVAFLLDELEYAVITVHQNKGNEKSIAPLCNH